jgi:hypothetical protein
MIELSNLSIEPQALVVQTRIGGQHGAGAHFVGAQEGAQAATQVADNRARSSSDSNAATGREHRRERRMVRGRAIDIDWVNRLNMDESPV